MTTINQVRMSHSESDTNSIQGRGERVSVHTHTDTHNAVESSTNQPTNMPDCRTRSHENPFATPLSRTGQTSSNVPKTLLASSARPIHIISSVVNHVFWPQFKNVFVS